MRRGVSCGHRRGRGAEIQLERRDRSGRAEGGAGWWAGFEVEVITEAAARLGRAGK